MLNDMIAFRAAMTRRGDLASRQQEPALPRAARENLDDIRAALQLAADRMQRRWNQRQFN